MSVRSSDPVEELRGLLLNDDEGSEDCLGNAADELTSRRIRGAGESPSGLPTGRGTSNSTCMVDEVTDKTSHLRSGARATHGRRAALSAQTSHTNSTDSCYTTTSQSSYCGLSSSGLRQACDEVTGQHLRCKSRRMISLPSHLDSYQISDLLNPPRGIRDEMQRRGITPRNHHRDNRAMIAERSARNHANKQMPPSPPQAQASPQVLQPKVMKTRNGVDYVTKNAIQAASAVRRSPKVEISDFRKKENFGKVPAYLLKRKVELAQDAERRLQENENKYLPPGLVLMEDNDRLDVLKTLQERKGKLETELCNMPLLVETPSQLRMKAELEYHLQEIEKSIGRFSRLKVYIYNKDAAS